MSIESSLNPFERPLIYCNKRFFQALQGVNENFSLVKGLHVFCCVRNFASCSIVKSVFKFEEPSLHHDVFALKETFLVFGLFNKVLGSIVQE